MSNVLQFPERRTVGWVNPVSREFLGFSVPFYAPSVATYVRVVDGEWEEIPRSQNTAGCTPAQ